MQFLKKDALCFDIGANKGDKTRDLLQLGMRVICIEPQIDCLKELHRNLRGYKNIIIVGKAIGSKFGWSEISISDSSNLISTLSDKWKTKGRFSNKYNWNRKQKVEIITLDSLIDKFGLPKFCKIDVEGYELEVFKGLTHKIPFICFEFTKEFLDDSFQCINQLLTIGNAKFNFVITDTYEFYFPKWVISETLMQTLNSFEDDLLWGDIYAKFEL